MGGEVTVAETLVEQLDMWTCDSLQAKAPDVRAHEACAWVRHNRTTWLRLYSLLHALAMRDDVDILRRGDLYIIAQQHGWRISEARELRFDNNLWSVLSRIAIMQDPTLARIIHPKRCDIDLLDLALIYHDDVDAFASLLSRAEFHDLMGWR